MEYKQNLLRRRRKLFLLMVTSCLSVLVMFIIDGYMHIFFTAYTTVEVVVTIVGRLLQYHGVTLLIYYILYWPYRRNFMPRGGRGLYDVSFI
jgi:hypothetical protein